MNSYDNETNQSHNIFSLVKWPLILVGIFFVLQVIVRPLFLVAVPVGYGAATALGGSVDEGVLLAGPHFIAPWKRTILMPLQTTVRVRDTSPVDSNNQLITAKVIPQVWIEPSAIPALARNYGDFESMMKSVVEPQINQATRNNTSHKDPEHLIWERHEVVTGIQNTLQTGVSEQLKNKGVAENAIHIGLVSIPQFGFSPTVRETLEGKAESHVKTLTAKAKAQIREIEADRTSRVTEIAADGDAEAKRLISAAQAYRVDKVGEVNAAAPDVAKYESIIKWLEAGGKVSRMQLGSNGQVILPGLSESTAAKQ